MDDDMLNSLGSGLAFTTLDNEESNEERLLWPETWANRVEKALATPPTLPPTEGLTPKEVLRLIWGYDSFRSKQQEIIDSVLAKQDTLGLLPTGGGKSLTFQIPGLILPGLTLVVTPLISLMKDQVDHLHRRGIKAAAIHSGMGGERIRQTLENCIFGRYKFLYVSPERLSSPTFLSRLEELKVNLIVVDECHCICQWGYDFRPSYLNIITLRNLLPSVPVLALTATATPEVAREITRTLGFGTGHRVFQNSFFRPNLSYSLRRTEDREQMLLHILSHVPGSAIVYCRSRDRCELIAQYLVQNGITAAHFHAGLTHTEREMRQNRWMSDEVRVMVATNAFGMGIDKPNVRLVMHINMPNSLEEYFQEAGRAGRDGSKAYAVMITSQDDITTLKRRLADSFPEKEYIYKVYNSMCNYLGIGEGEGYQRSYDFDIEQFVRTFKMRPVQTTSAIDIMQVAGWLDYHRDDTRSRLMILYTREELYGEHVGHDALFRILLRLYTGLFANYIFISETDIALQMGLEADDVYAMLSYLSHQGIVHYIPKKQIPRIYFHIRREDTDHLRLPSSAYEERKDRLEERISSSIAYLQTDNVCRSSMLLSYFGEQATSSCGMCDVCLKRTPQGLKQFIVEDTHIKVLDLLKKSERGYIKVADLVHSLSFIPEDTILALRYCAQAHEQYRLDGEYILLI
ncbi:MAG: ATP-dependent DNA helicase RecQ [Porphyromonadaceae bacterium]|nr:ATP-dependent DNA helicase RecQ [Porphyromonadaceae bacterium]